MTVQLVYLLLILVSNSALVHCAPILFHSSRNSGLSQLLKRDSEAAPEGYAVLSDFNFQEVQNRVIGNSLSFDDCQAECDDTGDCIAFQWTENSSSTYLCSLMEELNNGTFSLLDKQTTYVKLNYANHIESTISIHKSEQLKQVIHPAESPLSGVNVNETYGCFKSQITKEKNPISLCFAMDSSVNEGILALYEDRGADFATPGILDFSLVQPNMREYLFETLFNQKGVSTPMADGHLTDWTEDLYRDVESTLDITHTGKIIFVSVQEFVNTWKCIAQIWGDIQKYDLDPLVSCKASIVNSTVTIDSGVATRAYVWTFNLF